MVALSVVLVPKRNVLPKKLKWGLRTNMSRRMEYLRQMRGGQCEKCGSTSHLEFAHVYPTGLMGHSRGQWNRIKDIERYPAFYRLLCLDCHAYRDERIGAVRYEREMFVTAP